MNITFFLNSINTYLKCCLNSSSLNKATVVSLNCSFFGHCLKSSAAVRIWRIGSSSSEDEDDDDEDDKILLIMSILLCSVSSCSRKSSSNFEFKYYLNNPNKFPHECACATRTVLISSTPRARTIRDGSGQFRIISQS